MRRPWFIALLTVTGALLAAPAMAQPDDDPYGEPAAPPAAQPPAAQPPAAQPPAAQPPAPRPPAPKATEVPAPPPAETAAPVEHVEEKPVPADTGATAHAQPDEEHAPGHGKADPHEVNPSHREPTAEHGAKDEHGAPSHGAADKGHGSGHGDAHGSGHGDGHGAAHGPGEMNWIYGFIGTDAEAEPSLLWRKPDMPPPFLANIINFIVFAYVVVRFGKKPLQESLKDRKRTIMKDIDAATKMKDEASKRLEKYESKLKHIDDEIERIKKDFREQGEREKERILADAQEKKERMLKDAQFMIEQEVKQMRGKLMQETVEAAMKAAEEMLASKVSAADHDRMSEEYLKQLSTSGMSITKGGSA